MVSTNQLRYILFLVIFFILWLLVFLHTKQRTRSMERMLEDRLATMDNRFDGNSKLNLSGIYEKWSDTEHRVERLEEILFKQTKPVERQLSRKAPPSYSHKIAILIIACNRVEVKSIIQQSIEFSQDRESFPLFVSQDCGDLATQRVIRTFQSQLTYLEHRNNTEIEAAPRQTHLIGYYKISRHYKWAIDQVFAADKQIDSLIILEDDMMISFDFFSYFKAMRPLLDIDQTVWCISAWNDNGKVSMVSDNSLFYRTDFMPGLGWMLTRRVWEELRVKWPPAFWDDWMRGNEIRKNRVCIRPEVSRSKLYVQKGVSGGLFFDRFYKFWALNDQPFDFDSFDISSLTKAQYDHKYFQTIAESKTVYANDLINANLEPSVQYKIMYRDYQEYKRIATQFGLMDDERGGVLRTAYHGVVSFFYSGTHVHLVPAELLK